SKTTNRNFYWRSGTNYKLTDKSNLLFNYNLNLGNDRFINKGKTTGSAISLENDGVSKDKNYVHELSLQYKTKLDTLGRTFDLTMYSNFFGRNPTTEARSLENNTYTYNNSNADFKLANYYAKFDFAFPFEKLDFSVNTGGKYNVTKVTDFGRYNFDSADSSIFDSDAYASSINFDYMENNVAFYAEARKKYKKFNFTAGLRFEDFRVKRDASTIADEIKYNNTNLFPTAGVLYELTKDINLNASYSKKIAQPGYFTIDPNNSTFFNRYNTSEGNVALKPVFFDLYELKLTAFQYVQLGANYVVNKDKNEFVYTAEPDELVSNRTFASFDKMKTMTTYVSFPIPLDYFFKSKDEFQKRMNAIETMNYIFLNITYIKS
ncbi:MAG: TonB-dependent receptor, partial [Flavobacterium sp.]